MLKQSLLFDITIVVYACSVLLYFIDFLQTNRKANQVAFWLLAIVWVFQTIYIGTEVFNQEAIPLLSRFDTLIFYAWLLITLSLLINLFFKMDMFLFFTNIVGFSILAMSLFVEGKGISEAVAEQFNSEWLIIHISMAFLSYAAFTLSAVFAGIYLLQHRLLKQKKWNKQIRRGPSLAQLDRGSFYLILFGFPLLLLSLILGLVWGAYTLEEELWFLDTKVVFSIFALFMYGVYLYQRVFRDWAGKKITELNLICFLILLINYFLSNLFSRFHFWY